MELEDAQKYAEEIDKKRLHFLHSFAKKDSDYTKFDVSFNCMTMSVSEIVETIAKIIEIRDF